MADDIKLVIDVDRKGVLSAIKSTETLEAKVKKLSSTYASGAISYGRYNKGLDQLSKSTKKGKDELLAYGTALRAADKESKKAAASAKQETAAVKAYALARRQALEEDRRRDAVVKSNIAALNQQRMAYQANTKELYRIRMATDSVFAAEQKLLKVKTLLRAEVANGNMTMRQAAAAQMQYKKSLNGLSGSLIQGRNKMNSMSVVTQQAGYQMGDFIVQVQGGQSAFIAFSQQATQMVGFLPLMAKQLGITTGVAVGLSAALGIGIPLVASLAMVLWRTKSSAEDGAKGIKTYAEQAKEARTEIEKTKLEIAALNAGFRDTQEFSLFKGINEAKTALEEAVKARDELLRPKEPSEIVRPKGYENILGGSRSRINKGTQLQINAEIASREIANERAAEAVEFAEKEVKAREKVLRLLLEQRKTSGAVTRGMEDRKVMLDEEKSLLENRAKAVDDIIKARDKESKSLKDELELNKLILNYGKDSAEVKTLQAEQARNNYLAEQKAGGILGNNLNTLMEVYDENVKITGELDASADKGRDLAAALKEAASAMASLSGFGAGLDKALAVSVAKVNALKSGADAAIAGTIAGMRIDLAAKTQAALSKPGNDPILVAAESAIGKATISQLETSEVERKRLEAANRASSRGSGGGSKESPQEGFAEYLADKQKELELEAKLVGIFDTEREIQSELFKARDEYSGVITPAQEKELENTLRQTEAIKEQQTVLEEAKAQQEALADTISGAMGDAFMSIIDGTKSAGDAFKDMAKLIISELFKILVVEKMVKSISGAISGAFGGGTPLPSADGNVFSGGSHVQAYANGGVVGGPTYFPMSGGKTGLMGEAGPEAIMPLKRGSNGKLGVQMEGGATTTVVQNFNFQANGDDSVKKLIAQAAPKIAQMTKSSLLNDRRRGGSTKAAFG